MTDILFIVAPVLVVAAAVLLWILLRKASQTDVVSLAPRLDAVEKAQERTGRIVREELALSRDELNRAAKDQRQELNEAFKTLGASVVQQIMYVAGLLEPQLKKMSSEMENFSASTEKILEALRKTVEDKLQMIQHDNTEKLEQMRQTVDEKLQGTLEKKAQGRARAACRRDRFFTVHEGTGRRR